MGGPTRITVDVAVVGAGAAGLYAALSAAREGASVALVSATPLAESASYWAQGGIAAALAEGDSPALHLADTVHAGRGAVAPSVAEAFCDEAAAAVGDLLTLGVRFDSDRHGRLALGLEGGHSRRRVVHAGGSATGRRVTRELSALAAENERIHVLEGRRAVALLELDERARGLRCDDGREVRAAATILATGGAAALWSRTTNPAGATGGGLLLARAAGAALADLELVQFHPTAVAGTPADGFLVTEAVRGEGAVLLDEDGERFVDELAPRDAVARAIHERLTATGRPSVALDLREVDLALFPNVVAVLHDAGLDPAREPVSVAPAAHYMMGGIATDARGRSSLPGLFAVGECACTGLHGANRLASNSLSECFVFGARAARAALADPAPAAIGDVHVAAPPASARTLSPESRAALWTGAGLMRDEARLTPLLGDTHELVRLIAASALARRESRGAHRREDFPATEPAYDLAHSIASRGEAIAFEKWN